MKVIYKKNFHHTHLHDYNADDDLLVEITLTNHDAITPLNNFLSIDEFTKI